MAEQEVIGIAAPEDSPDWFKKWSGGLNYKILKLYRSISNSLTVKGAISSRIIRTAVKHAEVITLQHNLKREHDFVLSGDGRINNFNIVAVGANFVKIKPWLISTSTVTTSVKLEKQLLVLDSSIFKVGDVVQLNGDERKITGIVGNKITLSDRVDLQVLRSVTLARETVSFLIL